ncbi:hypothetical protein LTR85_011575 [Meristemomyces frigidus]|nr:hypothetical protein LTR85_011575 [Meristemomyces frigidus]
MAPNKRSKKTRKQREAEHVEREAADNTSTPVAHLHQDSPLLKIPPELRNIIYDLVLTSDKPIDTQDTAAARVSALLATCTQIRREAAPIFYGQNTFSGTVHRPGRRVNEITIFHWLTSIGKQQCALIQSLTLWWTSDLSRMPVPELTSVLPQEASRWRATQYAIQHFRELRQCGVEMRNIVCIAPAIQANSYSGACVLRFQRTWQDAMKDVIKARESAVDATT